MKAGSSKLPYSSPLSLKTAGNTHTQGQQSVRQAARSELRAARPSLPGARGSLQAEGGRGRDGSGRTAPVGFGELPTLSSTKSPSRGRRRWPPRVLVGRCPIAARTWTRRDGGAKAPGAAAHNGELGLQPQTLGAEAAPSGRMLSFQSPGACSLSCFEPGVLRERARRCCSVTAKDGEGGDWSGRGSAAATAAAGGGAGSTW